MSTDHPPDDALRDYLDGKMPVPEAGPIEAHLGGCEACAARLESLAGGADSFRERVRDAALTVTANQPGPPAGRFPSDGDRGDAAIGTLVAGRYKVRQAIGEGGMGTVYLAEQVQPVRRQVALKLIRAGMDSRTVLARFESERQALALMDHPHIARVLDAGTTEQGHPFFVMELVRGIPLTDFCDQHRLDMPTRLNLFRQICSAVQHAHQKGIIHRDLKPTNILVEDHAGTPVPKVIDFGLAKATSGLSLTEASLFTAFGTIAGTPLYMAPEQATFNSLDVDTRADIYALGVILYELLTGTTPIRKESLQRAALDEVMRVIREEEAQVPSHRISTSEALPSVAATRQVEPIRLGRFVRGDLDWIVMKALAKDRSRRYDSAIGLANDIERFLKDEPVTAGPPTARYRAAKFVRRHRGRVVAASLIVLALIGGVVGTTVGLFEARRQEQVARHQEQEARRQEQKARQQEALATERAEGERRAKLDAQEKKALAEANEKKAVAAEKGERTAKETAEAVLGFVETKVFAAARPKGQGGGLGYDVKLVDAIMAALPAIETSFVGNPLVEARLRMTIGNSFTFLDKPDPAAGQFVAARSLFTKHLGPDHPDTLRSMSRLADIDYDYRNQRADACKLYEEVLVRRRARLGPDHPETLSTMSRLAIVYSTSGRHADALRFFEETLALRRAKLGPDHPDTLRSMLDMANFLNSRTPYGFTGQLADARKLYEEVVARRRARLGPDHPDTLGAMIRLAGAYSHGNRNAEALKLSEEVLARNKANLGPDHPTTLGCMFGLAMSYSHNGRLAEAVKLGEETCARNLAIFGPDSRETISSRMMLSDYYVDVGRYAEAVKIREEELARQQAQYGPDAPQLGLNLSVLAGGYRDSGQHDRAVPLMERALAITRKAFGRRNITFLNIDNLAGEYAAIGERDKAIALDRELMEAFSGKFPFDSLELARYQCSVGSRLLRWEKWAEAEPLLRASLATREANIPEDWTTFDNRSLLGGALLGLGKADEARPLLVAGFEGMKRLLDQTPAPDRILAVAAADRLIRLAEATNNPDEARRWREEKAQLEAQLKTLYSNGATPQAEDAKPAPGDVKSAVPVESKPAPTPPPAGGKP